ncbi:B12-binding domain-containing radical SAM protein [Magnetococcus sp. PR-3]|uniref:B12-binding domain-containing radical SAM protein n=1 Tax=Magnetococcus sp. PR-3 TaxID=3120355 RepID=UPI002FCDFAC0
MNVGILEVMNLPIQHWMDRVYHTTTTKQMSSVMPQSIAVWCRQLGHQTYYKTYYGVGKIENAFPDDLDIIFISSSTINSPVCYALAKQFRKAGVRTVFGGPHARAFPVDCLRFFDVVVDNCDQALITDILKGGDAVSGYISSKEELNDIPTIEQRMPEILTSAHFFDRWKSFVTVIPTISSMGCPYTCSFCTDWDRPYRLLPLERLKTDLTFLSKNLKGSVLAFWEPNFAVKFERIFEVLESIPKEDRVPYMMECSQSILTPERIQRMDETNCRFFLIGVESWGSYFSKSGLGKKSNAQERFNHTVEIFNQFKGKDLVMQASLIFGLDSDEGELPVTLAKAFIQQAPHAWPTVNIPSPYGGTPLFDELQHEGRLLNDLPFNFYQTPYLSMVLKHYTPLEFYEKMLEISALISSDKILKKRMALAPNWKHKYIYKLRTLGEKVFKGFYQEMVNRLRTDAALRAFHEGRSACLPDFYQQAFEEKLGRFAPLLTEDERRPNLEQMKSTII